MHLTKKQEKILSGGEGEPTKKAMEILVGLGDIYEAEGLIPIHSAHISGVSIKTSGEAGLNFIEKMAEKGAEVTVPTTINPAGMDLQNWKALGAPEKMSKKQIRMVEAYQKMGAEPICSCVPYLIGNKPSFGKHIAWAESSAVVYANSVLGARTNREGGPSALASAITGLAPMYGYHLDENRKGKVRIRPETQLFGGKSTFQYSVLGYWIGENFPNSVPVIDNLDPSPDQHKALGAGMATSGAIAIYHVPGITPEAKKNPEICETEESVGFGSEELNEVVDKLDRTSETDLVCLGCPHSSIDELERIADKAEDKEIWACLGRDLLEKPRAKKIASRLKEKNVKLVCDTCMVVAPLSEMGYSSIGVNSAKAAHYAPSLAGVDIHFAPLEELVK